MWVSDYLGKLRSWKDESILTEAVKYIQFPQRQQYESELLVNYGKCQL